MPDTDGYALMRRVRALPPEQGGQVPAVALTAYAREQDRKRAIDAGYQLHLAKPIEVAQLSASVAHLIRNGKGSR
jgi:CheY-like chemotaxis protein